MKEPTRPTKKQRELLSFVERFVLEHGYGPSYREIMAGCSYSSVATVAVHVQNLIARGHLRKNGRSARSLELVNPSNEPAPKSVSEPVDPGMWLVERINHKLTQLEAQTNRSPTDLNALGTLIATLDILGIDASDQNFSERLDQIKKKL